MNRSPDEIFAAQFWGWPDPAIKRDAHGRVLFVCFGPFVRFSLT